VALLGLWLLPSLLARTASRHAFIRVGAIAGLALAALRVMFEPLLAVWFRMIQQEGRRAVEASFAFVMPMLVFPVSIYFAVATGFPTLERAPP